LTTKTYKLGNYNIFLIDILEDIRADECSTYATHLTLYYYDIADYTFMLHADADHHIYPTLDIFEKTLLALINRNWSFENIERYTRINSEIFKHKIWRALESEYSHQDLY